LMAVYFHLFAPVSIVANLFVIPVLSAVIALGLASGLASLVWPGLALLLNNANFFVLSGMLRGVAWMSRWPGGHWFVQAPPVWLTVGYYAVLLVWMSRRITRRSKMWVTGGAVAVAALILVIQHETVVEVTALDLRDGMAVFVNLPGEHDDFLVDGGGSSASATRVVVPFLHAQGVDRLAAQVLSCGDKAHAAGLPEVLRAVPARQAIHSGAGSRSAFFWDWWTAVRRHHLENVPLRAGDGWQAAGPFRCRVLHPPARVNAPRSDDNALVLLLEYGPTRVLLASDIGQSVEQRLVASNTDLRAQILIKGFHSVEPTGTDEFLDAVKPAIVVQTGAFQPSTSALETDLRDRLQRRGIRLYRTDEVGAVTIRLTARGYSLTPYRADAAQL